MNKNEKQLFLELCKFQKPNCTRIKKLIEKGAATPSVLGNIFFNRMAGVAYGVLKETGLLDIINREFRNTLRNAYIQNAEMNKSFFKCLKFIDMTLREFQGKYALLKGAYMCGKYPIGYRTSNDIDILTEPGNITQISEKLLEAGFKQGHLKNGSFVPATRQEIISSKMMRGETVPYIKEINQPFMKYLEVDINFSVSHKNENNNIVRELVSRAEIVRLDKVATGAYAESVASKTNIATRADMENSTNLSSLGKLPVTTLSKYDFLLYLCEHLYKEATIYPWVKMKRDMTFYKFSDIYFLLSEYTKEDYFNLFVRAMELDMETSCYYALYMTKKLYSMKSRNLGDFLARVELLSANVLDLVFDPENKKTYQYQSDNIKERFFCNNRMNLLKEVT